MTAPAIDRVADPAHPAMQAWYDQRERELVQREMDLIRVYQYMMPDGIGPYRDYQAPWPNTWWEEFWRSLERKIKERRVFVRYWKERNQPGGYQTSLTEMFAVDHERHGYIMAGQVDLSAYAGRGGADDA